MKKILILIIFFLLGSFYFPTLNKAYAGEVDVFFCSSDGSTIWGVQAYYVSQGVQIQSIPANSWTNQTGAISDPIRCNSNSYTGYTAMYVTGYPLPGNNPNPRDKVNWHTACADPEFKANLQYQTYFDQFAEQVWTTVVDVTCPSSDSIYDGTLGINVPASCDRASNSGKTIAADQWCPFGPYCMYAGQVTNNTLGNSNPGYCPGAFSQNQVVGTIPSSCGSGGTCNYTYCTSSLTCGSLTDTTGQYCGPSCGAASPPPTCSTALTCSNPQCPPGYTVTPISQGNYACANSSGQLDCTVTPYCPSSCPAPTSTTSGWTGETCQCGSGNVPQQCATSPNVCNSCSLKYCLQYSGTQCCYYKDPTCFSDSANCQNLNCGVSGCIPGSTQTVCSAPNVCPYSGP